MGPLGQGSPPFSRSPASHLSRGGAGGGGRRRAEGARGSGREEAAGARAGAGGARGGLLPAPPPRGLGHGAGGLKCRTGKRSPGEELGAPLALCRGGFKMQDGEEGVAPLGDEPPERGGGGAPGAAKRDGLGWERPEGASLHRFFVFYWCVLFCFVLGGQVSCEFAGPCSLPGWARAGRRPEGRPHEMLQKIRGGSEGGKSPRRREDVRAASREKGERVHSDLGGH